MAQAGNTQPVRTAPESISGVALMQGYGVREAKGFWADAWSQVLARPRAVAGLIWIGIVLFFAITAPFIASGHPLLLDHIKDGAIVRTTSPLWQHLSATDILLPIAAVAGLAWLAWPMAMPHSRRLTVFLLALLQGGLIIVTCNIVGAEFRYPHVPDWMRSLQQRSGFIPVTAGIIAGVYALIFIAASAFDRRAPRIAVPVLVSLTCWAVITGFGGLGVNRWDPPLHTFNYRQAEARGEVRAVYTLIPFSPNQRSTQLDLLPPGMTLKKGLGEDADTVAGDPTFFLGTDSLGQDVLSQMLHACRLSISIGLVSTGIAVCIGVTIGALMGYFGGWVDLVLFRVVEVFMAIPVLFLLIVAAAVLPRNTYVMMAIIGCVTWTGAARFIRAEFLKLRGQDFVQSAKAVGLPLRSILFRHMLPNGVTPVLVDASFAIAAAILAEATLSFLGLGPVDQASWGRLLSDAQGHTGYFVWWLAIFPGLAIFLTVLSYNLVGEALRDAIDPKLKKARV
jgi:peptide/nickel transport system permease protein